MTIAFTAAICIETVSQRLSQVTQFVKKVFRVFLTFLGFLIIVKFSLILKKIHRDNMDILPVSSLSLFSLILLISHLILISFSSLPLFFMRKLQVYHSYTHSYYLNVFWASSA